MQEPKLTQVTDVVHRSIPISKLEKCILSTSIFNRLHNVLQNSTVYLTYPSNRTSRFSHSLGCMHLAGQLFKAAISNSSPTDFTHFLQGAANLIATCQDVVFNGELETRARSVASNLKHSDAHFKKDHFFALTTPHRIDATSHSIYCYVFQAVRLVALLHDLGHPPFSHITEKAVVQLYEELADKPIATLSDTEKAFQTALERFRAKSKDFHEELGLFLTKQVIDCALNDPINSSQEIFDILMIRHLVLKILQARPGKDDFANGLHQIIDSSYIDADRLDYTSRDLCASGIQIEPLDYTRLINTYQMLCKRAPRFTLEFLPSTRALSQIEDFFSKRFFLYKYIIYHHRVAKFDALLADVIKELSRLALKQPQPPSNDKIIPDSIVGLWTLLALDHTDFQVKVITHFIQWDDNWLLTVLRNHYFREGYDTLPNSSLGTKLKELLANEREYFSLYKRLDCYLALDEAVAKAATSALKLDNLATLVGDGPLKKTIKDVADYLEEYKMYKGKLNKDTSEFIERRGLFTSLLFALAEGMIIDPNWLTGAVKEVVGNEDCFIIQRRIKTGVANSMPILADGKRVSLGQVSRIADHLNSSARLFPPIFVYLRRSTKISVKSFSKRLALAILSQFNINQNKYYERQNDAKRN